MITTKSNGQSTVFRMCTNSISNCLCNLGHQSRVLQFSDWRVTLNCSRYFFELVVSVELDAPTELFELVGEACIDQMDWPFIYSYFRLGIIQLGVLISCVRDLLVRRFVVQRFVRR